MNHNAYSRLLNNLISYFGYGIGVMNNYKNFLNRLTDDEPEPESEPGKYLINILTSNSQNFIIFTALTNEEYAV